MSCSATRTDRESLPGANELEVSVFGPGVGESIVVHLGNGRWLIVDSCIDPETRRPVALDYLERLGVNVAEQLMLVVITHWHDDHCRGAAEILRSAPNAELVLASALRTNELKQLLAASSDPFVKPSGATALGDAMRELNKRPKRDRAWVRWAHAGNRLLASDIAEVQVLSPSDEAFTRAVQEIASLLPRPGQRKRRYPKQAPNDVCVAVWLRHLDTAVLLGADLEQGGPSGGWQAVLAHPARPTKKASIFKVPHHGSPGADEPEVWTTMLTDEPQAVVTAYAAGRRALPASEDQARIAQRTPSVFLTSPAQAHKRRGRPAAVERVLRRTTPDLREVTGPMGHVRLRVGSDPDAISVELFGRAHRVTAA